jgi:hypothetical protein
MAKTKAKGRSARPAKAAGPYLGEVIVSHRFCAARFPKPPKLRDVGDGNRARLIRETAFKWMNGKTIKYWFYDKPARWTADESQENVVRKAFDMWKALGIGLDFAEVPSRQDADVRIAFDLADGSWSYVGTDLLDQPKDEQTMNFGWSLTADPQEGLDTALHEIGHTLGFPHEHQNPFAGIVWDEEAVYRSLAAPPNRWSRSTTFHNIIEKIVPDTVQGSSWDPNSVMHYPFEAGLILKPPKYRRGLSPKGGLSARDRSWVRKFYPPIKPGAARALGRFQSTPLRIAAGGQADFDFTADQTREYSFATFGVADTQLAVSGTVGGKTAVLAEDDDSGADRNAMLRIKLRKGEQVRVQVRMRYIGQPGEAALMVW